MREICKKWSVYVLFFFRSPKRNSFIDVIAFAWHLQQANTYSWVYNSAPSACMAQICNDGRRQQRWRRQRIPMEFALCMIIKAVIYTIISSFITSDCVAAVVPSTATATAKTATSTTAVCVCARAHNENNLFAHSHTYIVSDAPQVNIHLVAEKILSTFIHLLMWFMLII